MRTGASEARSGSAAAFLRSGPEVPKLRRLKVPSTESEWDVCLMKNYLVLRFFVILCLVGPPLLFAQQIMQTGSQFHGIRDFREVMPGVLYRGGANNGHAPLSHDELNALCEDDIGTAIYLYTTGFSGPSVTHCSKGSLNYIDKGWEGSGRTAVHKQIYDTIKKKE